MIEVDLKKRPPKDLAADLERLLSRPAAADDVAAQRRQAGEAVNAPNEPYRPLLSDAARPSTFNVPAVDENGATRDTPIAGEHPLTLYVDKREILTLMTLGAAPEALAIGYLRNQRLLDRIEDIVSVQVDWDVNAVVINTRSGLKDLEAKLGKRTTTSGCGQGTVFGDLMDEIDSVRLPADAMLTARDALRAARPRARARDDLQAGGRRARLRARHQQLRDGERARSCTSSRTSAGTTRSTRSPGRCGWTASTAATRSSTRPAG